MLWDRFPRALPRIKTLCQVATNNPVDKTFPTPRPSCEDECVKWQEANNTNQLQLRRQPLPGRKCTTRQDSTSYRTRALATRKNYTAKQLATPTGTLCARFVSCCHQCITCPVAEPPTSPSIPNLGEARKRKVLRFHPSRPKPLLCVFLNGFARRILQTHRATGGLCSHQHDGVDALRLMISCEATAPALATSCPSPRQRG